MHKAISTQPPSSGNVLLTGCIFLASIDVNSMLDYGLKASLGGGIWLGFKLLESRWQKKQPAEVSRIALQSKQQAFSCCLSSDYKGSIAIVSPC